MPPRIRTQPWRHIINTISNRRCYHPDSITAAQLTNISATRSSIYAFRAQAPTLSRWDIKEFSTSQRDKHPDLEVTASAAGPIIPPSSTTLSPTPVNPDTLVLADEPPDSLDLAELKAEDTFSRRYPAIVEQFVGLIMQDGKKARAQRYMAVILNRLRTAPAPKINSGPTPRPMIPDHPPGDQLPFDPIAYLTFAVDSISPLIRIRNEKGLRGGGAATLIPVPLNVRQRRRRAITWILDTASKRKNRGSGKNTFPLRVADEITAVVEGKSSIWDKRMQIHKEGVVGRINVTARRQKGRRM